MARAFQRWDVDDFLDEIPTDLYAEWAAFFTLEPEGYELADLCVGRLAWAAIAPHTKTRPRERDLRLSLDRVARGSSARVNDARLQAWAIRKNLEAKLRKEANG